MQIEERLAALGLTLPEAKPAGPPLPFKSVRVRGNHAYVAGHVPLDEDGSVHGIRGRLGDGVSVEQGYQLAHLATLAMLASLKRKLGDLDRISAWLIVRGYVNAAPGFSQTTQVINGCSELLLELFGPEVGIHARIAIGVAALPMDVPVEIEAEVEISEL